MRTVFLSILALCPAFASRSAEVDCPFADIRPKLAGEAPIAPFMQGRSDPFLDLQGVTVLGRTPVRASRDIPRSALSIGFETLDRETFDPKPCYQLLGQTGVKWARCSSGWMKCEREKGSFDFAWLDDVVNSMLAEGIQPWLQLGWGHPAYTPCKAYEEKFRRAAEGGPKVTSWGRGYVGEGPIYWGEEAMAAWKRYVQALARHFRGRIMVFEVWNEPEWFWRHDHEPATVRYGPEKAASDFAAFVRETGKTIRTEIPDAKIAYNLAELSCGWLPMLAKCGSQEDIDIYMYHGYEPYPEAALDAMFGQVRALFRRKDGSCPVIWQGESGRSTDKAANGVILPTPYSQARFIARRVTTDLAMGAEVSSIFTATDFVCYYPDGRDQFYGLIDGRTHKPKHGYYTFQCMGWLLDGLERAPEYYAYFSTRRNKEFTSEIPYAAVRTAAFKRKGVPVIAAWLPEHVELNAQPLVGTLHLVLAPHAGTLERPVLIDPVRCRVLDARALVTSEKPVKTKTDDRLRNWNRGIDTVSPFCVQDYPVFLTDARIFND